MIPRASLGSCIRDDANDTTTDKGLVMVILGWFLIFAGGTCCMVAMEGMRGHWGGFFSTMSGEKPVPPPLKPVLFLVIGGLMLSGGLRLTGHLGGEEQASTESSTSTSEEDPGERDQASAAEPQPGPSDEGLSTEQQASVEPGSVPTEEAPIPTERPDKGPAEEPTEEPADGDRGSSDGRPW